MSKQLKVLLAASEAYPFIKTGGLADVTYALPKALKKLGADVRVIIPKYIQIPWEFRKDMKHLGSKFVKLAWRDEYLGIEEYNYGGITYYFVDNEKYFSRINLYGEMDDCERFGFFSKAVLESISITGFTPDIIHCNDWHTGMVPLFLADMKRYQNSDIKTLFTIHNLRFQGVFPYDNLIWTLGLDSKIYFHDDGIKFHNNISFMKAGVNYCDFITTVSQTYAEEIKTPFYGEKLHGLFQHHSKKLLGIVNGVDSDLFNPEDDSDIKFKYSEKKLNNKYLNKRYLQDKMGLEVDSTKPIISLISRLDRQKGIHLIMAVLDTLIHETDAQFLLLGNGEHEYEEFFKRKSSEYPGRVASIIGFNHILAKEIYAGSDMLLMPSFFEPCGLSQLIAMRYGTVPVVRETGGLHDTVQPFNEYTDEGTGFSFTNYNAHDMLHVLKYATDIFQKDKNGWKGIMKRGMKADNSWDKSALEYLEIYKKI
ncbi:MAG: glycogen synthase GlgA [Fusobacteriaceae bacterium]